MSSARSGYHPTESKYKGGASEMYVTYDLDQKTRGGDHALYPKVKRVYIAGDVIDHEVSQRLRKRTGRQVSGVRIDYEQTRSGYRRAGFKAERGDGEYKVAPAKVGGTRQRFSQIVEVPEKAKDVHFYSSAKQLPAKYQQALQSVR